MDENEDDETEEEAICFRLEWMRLVIESIAGWMMLSRYKYRYEFELDVINDGAAAMQVVELCY